MPMNKLRQNQIKANTANPEGYTTLDQQLNFIEDRTRVIAKVKHEEKTAWDTGSLDQIDSDTTLDQIQLAKDGSVYYTTGTFISHVVDFAGYNIKFAGLDYTHTKPAGTGISYYTRSGDYQAIDQTWSDWQIVPVDNRIPSPNARYIQFKVVLTTGNTSITPKVSNVSVGIYASASTQEVFDARGGYATVNDRISAMGNIYHLKVIPSNGQTDIDLNRMIPDSTLIKVYLNGQLQSEGSQPEDSYVFVNSQIVRFNYELTSDDLVIIRIEGIGAGVVTVKENRVVGEIPTTEDNQTYTLVKTPIPDKEEVMVEGIRMTPGEDNDYIIDDNQIVFNYVVNSSFTVRVNYLYY